MKFEDPYFYKGKHRIKKTALKKTYNHHLSSLANEKMLEKLGDPANSDQKDPLFSEVMIAFTKELLTSMTRFCKLLLSRVKGWFQWLMS